VLPIFLSGCKTLLILPGKTYATRLWCVVEIFVFLQMDGERERMVVKPLDVSDEALHRSLAHFDAGKAECFLAKDRQKLLAVIEASFGTFEPFNRRVRSFFAEELSSAVNSRRCTSLASVNAKGSPNLRRSSRATGSPNLRRSSRATSSRDSQGVRIELVPSQRDADDDCVDHPRRYSSVI